ncbi:MAG TPA: glycosyltransferase family 39 protein [Candidatus Andersenbacteria bacterium]|nr:glycosyltransferase family 39 protein [Candidatus Andersenbacteria bacterium]
MSIVLHGLFAWHQPFTNDEGAYLYDARTILVGKIPGGDVLTKTPVSVLLFSASEYITHHSLFAARGVNILASLVSAIPLFLFVKSVANKKAARYTAIFWLVGPGPIIFYSLGHTQAIASLCSIISLLFWTWGIQHKKKATLYLLWAGIFFALAFATRKTAIALIAPYIVIFLLHRANTISLKKINLVWITGVCLPLILCILSVAALYGVQGVGQLVGLSYGVILSRSILDHASIVPWAEDIRNVYNTTLRIGTMYGIAFFITIGLLGHSIARRIGIFYARIIWALLAGISIALAIHMSAWIVFAGVAVYWIFWPPHINSSLKKFLIPISYIIALAMLYARWPVLLVEYGGDFLIPTTMICAFVLSSLKINILSKNILFLLFLYASAVSMLRVWQFPWTGMFTREAIYQAAHVLEQTVPMSEPIFTAAVIIPYVSGHEVVLNIAHPQWYTYSFMSDQDKNVFLPPITSVRDIIANKVKWAIDEQLTQYSYPDIPKNSWNLIQIIPNMTGYRNNPIKIYAISTKT